MVEVPCSCVGILTIGRWKDASQVGSLRSVSLGPIPDRHTLNIKNCVSKTRIRVKVIMT